jgi:hypothetical protein
VRIADRGRLPRRYETPASCYIRGARLSETGVIAMQKVVGSNPISRFFGNVLHVGGLDLALAAETRSNHPRISPPFRALVPEMTRMRGD